MPGTGSGLQFGRRMDFTAGGPLRTAFRVTRNCAATAVKLRGAQSGESPRRCGISSPAFERRGRPNRRVVQSEAASRDARPGGPGPLALVQHGGAEFRAERAHCTSASASPHWPRAKTFAASAAATKVAGWARTETTVSLACVRSGGGCRRGGVPTSPPDGFNADGPSGGETNIRLESNKR